MPKALIKKQTALKLAQIILLVQQQTMLLLVLTVSNSAGITIGPKCKPNINSILGNAFVTANAQLDENYIIKVTSTFGRSQQVDEVIDAANNE